LLRRWANKNTLLRKMAAKLGLYSPTTTFLAPSSQSPLYPLSFTSISPKRRANNFKVHADLGKRIFNCFFGSSFTAFNYLVLGIIVLMLVQMRLR
jgi:hypothetical protein